MIINKKRITLKRIKKKKKELLEPPQGDKCQYAEHAKLLQSCLTLYDPMDCGPPGFSVHGILQARILEWVPFPSPMHESEK